MKEYKVPVGSSIDIFFQRRMLLDGVGGSELAVLHSSYIEVNPRVLVGACRWDQSKQLSFRLSWGKISWNWANACHNIIVDPIVIFNGNLEAWIRPPQSADAIAERMTVNTS